MTDRLRLSPPDEYFNHQFALPHQVVASSDPNWRERYWISIFDTVGRDTVLSIGFGKYPNRDTMDGFAILSRGGKQTNLRLSRALLPHADRIAVGPLSAEIVAPLETLCLRLDENPAAIGFHLTWRAAVAPALEGRHFEVHRARVAHDLSRYVQTGRIEGQLTIGGETMTLEPDRWWGVRDHSWGIRPMAPVPGDPPQVSVRWNFLAFCPIQFPDFSLHIYLFESQPGRPTHLTATILRPPGAAERDDEIRSVAHDFIWEEGAPTPSLRGGSLRIEFYNDTCWTIDLEACPGRAYLSGGGYGTIQGQWRGESHIEHDVYDLTDPSRLRAWASHSSDHLIEARCGDQRGFGIIEYMVRRGYGKYQEARVRR
ncbi:hypothetical protein [Sphingomonas sp.]|uniref:hypothetical protein n=1 Tax=Sphingomonas sp. TaxID=28214 RepID=UPI001EC69189|nr:hypothetical protein [Sphingomonas sp.]MBX3595039.1 hypothetical protein [Sphingomonas sp.]